MGLLLFEGIFAIMMAIFAFWLYLCSKRLDR